MVLKVLLSKPLPPLMSEPEFLDESCFQPAEWSVYSTLCKNTRPSRFLLPHTWPASALGDSMDQLSQRSSSERTQFMSREDLDQEGSLDLDHEQYHYRDQDLDLSTDQELEHQEDQDQVQRHIQGANVPTPTKTLELKVQDERKLCTELSLLFTFCSSLHFSAHSLNQSLF